VLGVQPGEEVDALLTNVTVANNICDLLGKGGHGANVYLHLAIDATFVNTIVSGGLLGEGIYVLDFDPLVPDALAISYSDFWGNAAGEVVSADHGELVDTLPIPGLLRADPLFVHDGEDFGLQTVAGGFEADSPCVDAGYPGEDWADPDGSAGDLGAFGGPEALHHDTTACDGPGDGDPCDGGDDDATDDDDVADDDSATEYKTCVCDTAGDPTSPAWLLFLGAFLLQRRKSG